MMPSAGYSSNCFLYGVEVPSIDGLSMSVLFHFADVVRLRLHDVVIKHKDSFHAGAGARHRWISHVGALSLP